MKDNIEDFLKWRLSFARNVRSVIEGNVIDHLEKHIALLKNSIGDQYEFDFRFDGCFVEMETDMRLLNDNDKEIDLLELLEELIQDVQPLDSNELGPAKKEFEQGAPND